MDNGGFACRSQSENDVGSVSEDPDIIIGPLDVNLSLINVDERTLQEPLPQQALSRRIVLRKAFEEFYDRCRAGAFAKRIFHDLSNEMIRQTKYHTLINDPCLKRVTKQSPIKIFDSTWVIIFLALAAIAFFPNVFGYCFATSILREMEVNDRMFDHVFSYVEGFAFVLWARASWCNSYNLADTFRKQSLICLMTFLAPTFLRLVAFRFSARAQSNSMTGITRVSRFQYGVKDVMNVHASFCCMLFGAIREVHLRLAISR